MPADRAPLARLRALAKLHHLQPGYISADAGKRRPATREGLSAVLSALDVEHATGAQIERSIARRCKALRARTLEPVHVAWNGRASLTLRLAGKSPRTIRVEITDEDGALTEHTFNSDDLRTKSVKGPDGEPEAISTLKLSGRLATGYHDAVVTIGRTQLTTRLLSAPTRCYQQPEDVLRAAWGLFCPTYAIRSERDTGCGDLTDLRHLAAWAHTKGSRVIATLPQLAVYLDEPFEQSPYSPVSKLFWNELFLDATSTPEFERTPKAKRAFESQSYRREVDALRAGELVQYRRQAQVRRSLVEHLADRFFDKGSDTDSEFNAFLDENPLAQRYARFRAVMERQRRGWSDWSARLREGRFRASDFDARAERFHLYSQFRFQDQLRALASEMTGRDGLLYLDLAVGVRGDGFDAFVNQDLFGLRLSVGAPPDPTFLRGQDWGFPPMLPDAMREDRYEYFIQSIRAHMRHAGALRLDHVMAFYRLWWVPVGYESTHGVYAHYRMDEQIAVLSIESHRNACQIVGEDLGTVPAQVERALEKHVMGPLFVAQMSTPESGTDAIGDVRPGAVASLNTHDMAPFAKWWDGSEADDRLAVGLIDELQAQRERDGRAEMRERVSERLAHAEITGPDPSPARVRDAFHQHIASGDGAFVLVNAEDLWLETGSQNIPGTTDEHPNWRRRTRYELEEIEQDADIARQLENIDRRAREAQPSEQTSASTPSH